MSKPMIFVSATIVLFFTSWTGSWASPLTDIPDANEQETSTAPPPMADEMAISPAPTLPVHPKAADARYYRHQQQLTFRAGLSGDLALKDYRDLDDSVLGFQYLFPRLFSPKLEAGADLHEEGRGHIHAGIRWIWNERLYFRPSLKLGLDHRVESKDGLATLTHFENYFARLSSTLEYVFWNPYSVRLEPELLIGFEKPVLVVTLGLSHGW